jgi:rSAM/selenodomain-associated transferase 2
MFSIIIPVLNEVSRINLLIDHLVSQDPQGRTEIIVVDGDARGGTINAIENDRIIKLTAPKGRAVQMNVGAEHARGDILIFLHADSRLPPNALGKVANVLENGKYLAGAFDLAIDSDRLLLKYIGARARLRSRLNRIPYGDQAIFMRKAYFHEIGRFKEIPLMEDIDLMRRIKRRGDRIFILPDRVKTSPRQWEKHGIVRTTLMNQVLVALYYLGVSPHRLARYYWRH